MGTYTYHLAARFHDFRLAIIGSAFLCLCLLANPSKGQTADADSTLTQLYNELDDLFAEDSLDVDLFALVDSLLEMDPPKISSLHARIGYVSQVTSAGRNLDVEQFGFSPGLSFFHHTGLFADASGFVNSEYDQAYYLTTASLGYMHFFKKWLTVSASHDFYFYHDTLNHQFDKSAQLATFIDYRYINLGIDYSYLYGENQAHRLMGNLSFDINLGQLGFIQKLSLHPGASLQWGNADVIYIRQSDTPYQDLYQIVQEGNYPDMTYRDVYRLGRLLSRDRDGLALLHLRELGYTLDDVDRLFTAYSQAQIQNDNVYGVMNYAFSLPVVMQLSRQFTLLASYTYNVPVDLPNETYSLENNGFFSLSLAYKIAFVR